MFNNYVANPYIRNNVGDWDHLEMPIIPKCKYAVHGKDFRGITRLPVMKKLMHRALQEILKDIENNNIVSNDRTYGFKPACQTHDIIWICNGVMDWAKHSRETVYLCKVDIVRAFDRVKRSAMLRSMLKRKIHL